jgi:ATP-binding cassette subfamily C protein LapB
LLLRDDAACVLLAVPDEGKARVRLPENPDAEIVIDVDELRDLCTGYAILAGPLHRYDERTPEQSARGMASGHWFWGTLGSRGASTATCWSPRC